MTELDILIQLLAGESSRNPKLRDGLVETMLAVMTESESSSSQGEPAPSYLDLLRQLEEQAQFVEQQHKYRLSAALRGLHSQLHDELQQSALAIHTALRAGRPPETLHLQRTELDVTHFPVGFPPPINLLRISEQYVQTIRELTTLQREMADSLPDLTQKLTLEQQAAARRIREPAWIALNYGLLTDKDVLQFHETCLHLIQQRRIQAHNRLIAILTQAEQTDARSSLQKNLHAWLHQFGSPCWTILKELAPHHKKLVINALARSSEFLALLAIPALEPDKADQAEFETLLIARFGDDFRQALPDWQTWLMNQIDKRTNRTPAVAFWHGHPYHLPALIAEWFEPPKAQSAAHLEIPAALSAKMAAESGAIRLSEILERRRGFMTADEIHLLELAAELPSLDLRADEAPEPPSLPTEPKKEQLSPLASGVLAGIAETALAYARGGDLAGSALSATVYEGSKAVRDHLTVEIEDEAPQAASAAPTITFAPPAPPEPEPPNLWDEHIFPFVTENWAPLLGGSMILTGLLLLEFYIWNRAPWLRYGISPIILTLVASVLAFMGRRLQKEERTDTPIAIIQGFTVFLAPLSLLFAALFFMDSQLALPSRMFWGLLLTGGLLAAWGYIFWLAITLVERTMAGVHSLTLLLLNALLLLLPVAQLTPDAKAIFVIGFYLGFVVLGWSMSRVFHRAFTQETAASRRPLLFYSITCLGTYLLVWGLTHARLMLLPRPATYAPLIILFSFLLSMVEFQLLERAAQPAIVRIGALSYSAYFAMGLGLLLSLGHEYLRVVTLLLIGLVWLYQAVKLVQLTPQPPLFSKERGSGGQFPPLFSKEKEHGSRTPPLFSKERGLGGELAARHFNIAFVILTLGCSLIALVHHFPPVFFPYLALAIAVSLYALGAAFPIPSVSAFVRSFSLLSLIFAFIAAIIWQWDAHIPPFGYGIAFALFGLFTVYIGAIADQLIHVHVGAIYLVAALPYLGAVDMVSYRFERNLMVLGLAGFGIVWLLVSSFVRAPALRDSRSTVLWNVGVLSLCLLCLRLLPGAALESPSNYWLQFQLLNAPVIIAALMFLVGFFTRSYLPVYLGLFILVFILPEIKERLHLPTLYGLGGAVSAFGLLALALILRWWKRLEQQREHFDLIWRKKAFPLHAPNDYRLFAEPFVTAAFFLCVKMILITYPLSIWQAKEPLPILLPIAVLLSGTCLLFFSIWYRDRWFSAGNWYTYLGFIAIVVSIIHSCYSTPNTWFTPKLLPLVMLVAFLYCEGLRLLAARLLTLENAARIVTPFRHLRGLACWGLALSLYSVYSVYYVPRFQTTAFPYWIPLCVYLIGVTFWSAWQVKRPTASWGWFLPGYLLFWQLVVLIATRGTPLPDVLAVESPSHLGTAGMVLGIVALFLALEWLLTREQYQRVTPLLWISLVFLSVSSGLLSLLLYASTQAFSALLWPIGLWAGVSLLLGRFLNISVLWLWGGFLLHLLWLPSAENFIQFYRALPPLALAGIAVGLAVLTAIVSRWKWLSTARYPYPWANDPLFAPPVLLALTSQAFVLAVLAQATLNALHRHHWLAVLGLFGAALPALLVAREFSVSRRLLFSLPYLGAWIGLALACKTNFPDNSWLASLATPQLISAGIFGALLTLLLSERFKSGADRAYQTVTFAAAIGILLLLGDAYLSIHNLDALSWQWLLTSGVLAGGTGVYFRVKS